MEWDIHPAHECERCGCDGTTLHTDAEDDSEYRLCHRCLFVVDEPMTDLDRLDRELWGACDSTGTPTASDVFAFIQERVPPETYEIQEPDDLQTQADLDRSARIRNALDSIDNSFAEEPQAIGPLENIIPGPDLTAQYYTQMDPDTPNPEAHIPPDPNSAPETGPEFDPGPFDPPPESFF